MKVYPIKRVPTIENTSQATTTMAKDSKVSDTERGRAEEEGDTKEWPAVHHYHHQGLQDTGQHRQAQQ